MSPRTRQPLGTHILLDLAGVSPDLLDDPAAVEELLTQAAEVGGATVVDRCLHRFAPQGVSGVVVLAESHIAVHTWPEHGMAAIDVFTCGTPGIARAVTDAIVQALAPTTSTRTEVERSPLREAP